VDLSEAYDDVDQAQADGADAYFDAEEPAPAIPTDNHDGDNDDDESDDDEDRRGTQRVVGAADDVA
jgi:hypothetical protein